MRRLKRILVIIAVTVMAGMGTALPAPAQAQGAAVSVAVGLGMEVLKNCSVETLVNTLANDPACQEAKLVAAVTQARKECAALRQCKTDCRGERKDERRDAREDKKLCVEACDALDDRKDRRACRDVCRGEFKGSKKDAKAAMQSCKNGCRSNPEIYTDACVEARKAVSGALPKAGVCGIDAIKAACTAQAAEEDKAEDAAAEAQTK